MAKFRVGDVVRRHTCELGTFHGMAVGDTDRIVAIRSYTLILSKFGEGHDPDMFSLFEGKTKKRKFV